MKKHALISLFSAAALVAMSTTVMYGQYIKTIAGTGVSGYSGDGGLAIGTQLSYPSGVSVDALGNVYIADKNNYRVRKIAAGTGIISTFAGTGSFGGPLTYGIAPTSCAFEYPIGVFSSPTGDLLVTDNYRDMTFYIDHVTGEIFSRLGCGTQGTSGDGGPANMAMMELPLSACEDGAGNTYIADGWLGIRKVTAATGLASLVTATAAQGVFFDLSTTTDLYFSTNNTIKKLNVVTGAMTTVAGTGVAGYSGNAGPAVSAQLSNPGNMFIDAHRILYVCDRGNNAIREINLNTGNIMTIAGNGTMGFSGDGGFAPFSRLNDPEGVWVDMSGYIYIADAGNQRVRMIIPKGAPGGGGTSSPKALNGMDNAVNEDINVYPNPSNGMFTLQVGSAQVGASVNVYSILGQLVYQGIVADVKNTLDLSKLPSGIYTLMMRSDSGTYTQKLTKQ